MQLHHRRRNLTQRQILPLAVSLLLVASLMAGCSNTGGSQAPEPQASQSPEPGATEPPTGTSNPAEGVGQPEPGTFSLQQPGDAPEYTLELVTDAPRQPVYVTSPPEVDGLLYVVEKHGTVRVLDSGELVNEVFLDLSGTVEDSGNEQGLLSIAFHPDFANNGYVFVSYTGARGQNVLARYETDPDQPVSVDPDTRQVILEIPQPYSNHNGGFITFGPAGYLYLGLGDGGGSGDPERNGQNPHTLLGAILRLGVDGPNSYSVPDGNPFDEAEGKREIWAYGLRNPWRFAFDAATGALYIADVGQDQFEEINFEPAGSPGGVNYGWRAYEGEQEYNEIEPTGEVTFPVAQYTHEGGHCSITGGTVYRGAALQRLRGWYIYGDFCSGQTWLLGQVDDGTWQTRPFLETGLRITSFGTDSSGELYVVDYGGAVYKLVASK